MKTRTRVIAASGIVVVLCAIFYFTIVPIYRDYYKYNGPTVSDSSPTRFAQIEIVDWINRLSGSGSYFFVEGILRNNGDKTARRVKVKIRALDRNGKLVSLEDGYADPYDIPPGRESTFSVMVDYSPKITQFQINTHWE